MSYSNAVTKESLKNVLNEVLPIYNSTGFTVESIVASSATSVSANGGTAWIQVRIPSDKDPVCIVGYYLNGGSGCSVYNQSIGHDSNGYYASFALRNGQTTTNNVTITAHVLCKQQLTHFSQASADYIVEQGASGIWTYRKWNSGIAECWYTNNFTVNFDNQIVRNLRTSNSTSTVALPSILLSVTELYASGYNPDHTGWGTLVTGAEYGSNISLSYIAWTTEGNQTINVSIYLKGTWK